jgi:hypothetical protein
MAAKEKERTTIRVDLEGRYAGWWADCDDDPDWAFLDDVSGNLTAGQFGAVGLALLRVVGGWNFTDKAGEALPVTEEGLRRVPARAVLELANAYIRLWGQLPNRSGGA